MLLSVPSQQYLHLSQLHLQLQLVLGSKWVDAQVVPPLTLDVLGASLFGYRLRCPLASLGSA
jgi:hypothetical protein